MDGITPHIGNDGYWYAGSTKLSLKAQGPIGPAGPTGGTGPTGPVGPQGPKGDKPNVVLGSDGYLTIDGAKQARCAIYRENRHNTIKDNSNDFQ